MGNCLRHGHDQSSMQWGGDDWGSPANDEFGLLYAAGRDKLSHEMAAGDDKLASKMEEKAGGLVGHDRGSSTGATKITEVKIKITRKQLEELLRSAQDIKDLSVHQVLAQIMNASDQYETHQRSWRPALQSIPEVN